MTHSADKEERILLIRNDKLGDFMLAWPSYAMLKKNIPNCTTFALVPEYTREIAESCPWIDQVLIDPGNSAGWRGVLKIRKSIRRHRIDAIITLFSTTRIAFATLFVGARYRIAPATKFAQLFYHNKITQRRSQSRKPEFEYNLDLVRAYLRNRKKATPTIEPAPPYFFFPAQQIHSLKEQFLNREDINPEQKLIMIHPSSGGSASNLSHQQYAELARKITSDSNSYIILSAGPDEERLIQEFSMLLKDVPHTIFISTAGLTSFAQHIAFVDLFVSGSTGPLHIAGALNRPTAAFYPRRKSATALRWKTINEQSRQLAFSPPEGAGEEEMSAISIQNVANTICSHFL